MNKFEQVRTVGLGQEGGLGQGLAELGWGGFLREHFLNRSPPSFGQTDSQIRLKTLPSGNFGKNPCGTPLIISLFIT